MSAGLWEMAAAVLLALYVPALPFSFWLIWESHRTRRRPLAPPPE